jgi:putative transposase
MVTPAARREAVVHLRRAFEVSERRPFAVIGVDRTWLRYRSRRADDAAVRARLRELGAVRRLPPSARPDAPQGSDYEPREVPPS